MRIEPLTVKSPQTETLARLLWLHIGTGVLHDRREPYDKFQRDYWTPIAEAILAHLPVAPLADGEEKR